jgi:hypothetical protein
MNEDRAHEANERAESVEDFAQRVHPEDRERVLEMRGVGRGQIDRVDRVAFDHRSEIIEWLRAAMAIGELPRRRHRTRTDSRKGSPFGMPHVAGEMTGDHSRADDPPTHSRAWICFRRLFHHAKLGL